MRIKPVLAGAAAGVVIASGGILAIDAATQTADAQGSNEVTKADVNSANQRSIRAIKQGTEAWNLVAKFLAEPGERIAVNSPRVSQEPGVGGGIPGSLIADEAIGESKLSDALRAKLDGAGQRGPAGPGGPPGPAGPQGAPGPSTGSAGGDLSGNYPDPQIADGAVGPQQHAVVPAANVNVDGPVSVPNQASPRTDLPLRSTGGLNGFATGDLTVDTATDRFIVSTPGIYHLLVRVQWDDVNPGGISPGRRQIVVTRQFGSTGAGANNIGTIAAAGGTDPVQIGSWYAALGAGDRVSVDVTQETDDTQSVTAGSKVALVWVAPT